MESRKTCISYEVQSEPAPEFENTIVNLPSLQYLLFADVKAKEVQETEPPERTKAILTEFLTSIEK